MEIPILFGRYLVRNATISEAQLSEMIKVQYENIRSFSVTALKNEYIRLDEFKNDLAHQRREFNRILNEFREKGTMELL